MGARTMSSCTSVLKLMSGEVRVNRIEEHVL